MPITPGVFGNSKPLVVTRFRRAYADVQIVAASGTSPVYQCLVDTGADYTILPMSAATAAGITPSGPSVRLRTASGATFTLPTHPAVPLLIEGYANTLPVAFSTGPAFVAVLGRLEIVQTFDIGLDISHWHWG